MTTTNIARCRRHFLGTGTDRRIRIDSDGCRTRKGRKSPSDTRSNVRSICALDPSPKGARSTPRAREAFVEGKGLPRDTRTHTRTQPRTRGARRERACERASDRQRASERQRGRDQYIYIERAHRCGDGLDDAAQASQPPEQPQHPQRTQRLRARSCGACVRVRARARARPCGVRVFAPVLRMPVSLAHARSHSERPSEEAKPFRTVRPSVRPSQETAWRRHVPERT